MAFRLALAADDEYDRLEWQDVIVCWFSSLSLPASSTPPMVDVALERRG